MPRTLTFLPGTMCDHRLWDPVRSRLEPRFSTAYLPIERQATRDGMLALLATAAEPAPLHLVAFSMGGYLALNLALEHPGSVASLVTVATVGVAALFLMPLFHHLPQAVLAGMAWNLTGAPIPGPVDEVLQMLGTAVVPLCLVAIGLSLGQVTASSPAGTVGTVQAPRPVREPRPHAPSEVELAAHARFLARLKDALWLKNAG